MTENPWPSEWLRGALEVCVLAVLADGPTYGYAITSRLGELGLGTVKGGTLYPLLARLEQAGHVSVEWRAGDGGPGRKYFELTESGALARAHQADRWSAFADLTTTVVTGGTALRGGSPPPVTSTDPDAPAEPVDRDREATS